MPGLYGVRNSKQRRRFVLSAARLANRRSNAGGDALHMEAIGCAPQLKLVNLEVTAVKKRFFGFVADEQIDDIAADREPRSLPAAVAILEGHFQLVAMMLDAVAIADLGGHRSDARGDVL